ncbi:transposase [Thiolapillus sp.]
MLKVSNGPAEGLNSRIKMIKVRSRGFRNKERFANAIAASHGERSEGW